MVIIVHFICRQDLAARDVLVFLLGINTGLRVNDLVRLKVNNVRDKDVFTIREGKTHKKRQINVGMLRKEIARSRGSIQRLIYSPVRREQDRLPRHGYTGF